MQCRAIARRSEHGSLTVLGDLAQGTTPWAARGLGGPAGPPRQAGRAGWSPLTTGFRVPGGGRRAGQPAAGGAGGGRAAGPVVARATAGSGSVRPPTWPPPRSPRCAAPWTTRARSR